MSTCGVVSSVTVRDLLPLPSCFFRLLVVYTLFALLSFATSVAVRFRDALAYIHVLLLRVHVSPIPLRWVDLVFPWWRCLIRFHLRVLM